MHSGIAIGLLAALLQSLSYLVSASFVRGNAGRPGAATALVARSYLVMGAFSALALPVICHAHPGQVPPFALWGGAAAGAIVSNMIAQAAMFFTLKAADASRVSPLLGVKILFLALLGIVFAGDHYGAWQWTGIGLALISALLLSRSGGRLGAVGIVGVAVTALAYAGSDFCIRLQQTAFHEYGERLAASGGEPLPVVAANLTILWGDYVLGGVAALVALPFTGRYPARAWPRHVLPYAAVWLGAMTLLYLSFELLGVVHGTIVQSTRGLISIALGWALARLGGSALERRLAPRAFAGRVFAGALMFLAILVFSRR